MVGSGQLFELFALLPLSWCGQCPRLHRCQHHMGHRIGVWTGKVPNKSSALLPRSNGDSIKTFTVWMTEIHRLQHRRDLCSSNGILTTALIPACRGRRPAVILYLKPCISNSSTWPPHGLHEWGQQRGTPRQRLTAMRTTSSSRWNPNDRKGRAFSQALDSLDWTARSLARSLWPAAEFSNSCCFASNVGFIPCTLVLFH